MQFNEFVETVKERVSDICGPEFTVRSYKVLKNNSVALVGLSIMEKGINIAPAIYLDSFYTDFCDGHPLDVIINEILRIYSANRSVSEFDAEIFNDFDKLRSRITYKLINHDQNLELLDQIPHRCFLDLEIIYSLNMGITKYGNASVTIYKEHMNAWRTDEQTLYELASGNTPELLKPEIRSMQELIRNMIAEEGGDISQDYSAGCDAEEEHEPAECIEDEVPMYVLSNKSHFNGAACVLYSNVLDRFADKAGRDLFIIPSSVHEVILIPDNGRIEQERLKEMISDVNCTQVSAEEILSYGLYYYSRQDRRINAM